MRQDLTFTASELLILGIFYRRISSMLLHWIPSKQDWINFGLLGNLFVPIGYQADMKTQNKDYLEGNDNIRPTERP